MRLNDRQSGIERVKPVGEVRAYRPEGDYSAEGDIGRGREKKKKEIGRFLLYKSQLFHFSHRLSSVNSVSSPLILRLLLFLLSLTS